MSLSRSDAVGEAPEVALLSVFQSEHMIPSTSVVSIVRNPTVPNGGVASEHSHCVDPMADVGHSDGMRTG